MSFLKIRNTIKNTLNNNSGFTLIETLIAITLFSLIVIPVFMVTSDTVSFIEKVKNLNFWNKELVYLERILRKSIEEVQIPFWIREVEVVEGIGSIKVPYWNGDADLVLEMEIEDTTLKITTPEGSTVFTAYEGLEFGLLKDSKSGTIGLSINIKKIKRKVLKLQCNFGAIGGYVFNEK